VAAPAQPVQGHVASHLRDPGADRALVSDRVEADIQAREHLLKCVLGVVGLKPERAAQDRVDERGVAFDERPPRILVTGAAARDQRLVIGRRRRRD
jgi:hypothetical protein